tara:strand:- start:873 stop:1460 length:588 start_codon:yes stop_codon:yes gene_type:complete
MKQDRINFLSIDCDFIRTVKGFDSLIIFYLDYLKNVDLKNILFSQIHANIFYLLEPLYRQNKQIDIVNIDWHHDVYYGDTPPNDNLNSSCWLGHYLLKKNFIQNAYWLADYNSPKDLPTHADDFLSITYDLDDVKFKKFDYIFVCNSPKYSNLLSEAMYKTLVTLTKKYKNCSKDDFYKPNLINHASRDIYINET